MPKAIISVEGLRIRANHGVFLQETLVGNVFEVSLRLSYPPALEAMDDDDLAHSLNYAEVIEIVKICVRSIRHADDVMIANLIE